MINVILVGSETSGNIGAIARAMANFDLKNLILVNPKVNHLSQESRNRAKHAQDILLNAKVVKRIPKMDCLVATSAITGTSHNPRSPLTPSQLVDILPKGKKTGLLIGREGTGLTNEEIMKADFVVNIPSSKKYPTLNVSQACVVLFYELFEKIDTINELASTKDREIILKNISSILSKLKFSTPEKKKTQKIVWKRVLAKSFLTKREAFALIGFFKKLK
jgi:tRNA/rRNA methyltransferase